MQQGCRPGAVVKEISSGLNGNRRRLRRLVEGHTVGTQERLTVICNQSQPFSQRLTRLYLQERTPLKTLSGSLAPR